MQTHLCMLITVMIMSALVGMMISWHNLFIKQYTCDKDLALARKFFHEDDVIFSTKVPFYDVYRVW